ncbi:GAF domain-containing protein [Methylobacterium sp. C25]|uniref:ATP-binding protein n=1 Tax=Methylobacterium sp. C25 TaxID=2721622 RepID=UPI001F3C964A|nr:ATP-binding protein [Methylobacterium sp. C25]MCE4226223.1 GAF domain-containing protein [Methylobacterium sp. C25]
MDRRYDAAPRLDLTACDREPIHIVGSVQPHGFLLTLDAGSLVIAQASANAPAAASAGSGLDAALPELVSVVRRYLDAPPTEDHGAHYLRTVTLGGDAACQTYEVAAHRVGDLVVLELEEVADPDVDAGLDAHSPRLRAFVQRLRLARSIEDLCAIVAEDVRSITGFDRVLVYRFDRDWHGTVLAEDGNDTLPSYLDLRFPATDIPVQARELYRRNRLRIIPDAGYVPVPIQPALTPAGKPLDLSQSVLRSVSPVHVEYMRNMGTGASMSVSILVDDELWGLVSCHNREPRRVPLQARNACDFLTQIFALQLFANERSAQAEQRLALGAVQSRLLGFMAEEDSFVDGLLNHPDDVMALANAAGAAIVTGDRCRLIGSTPTETQVRTLYDWLASRPDEVEVFAEESMSELLPEADAFADRASGLLAISVSKRYASYILWFRPEVVRTVKWGGNPVKAVTPGADGEPDRLHPRKSFEIWKETLKGRALPWTGPEVDAARDLRTSVIGIVLRRAEELAAMSEELQRSNKELEAFSYSVSHDLRAPFRHIVGYSNLLKTREGANLSEKGQHYVDTIIEAAFSAGTLVDNLLSFSQMGRHTLNRIAGDMNALVEEERRKAMRDVPAERKVRWEIGPLGRAHADPFMLRLVIENLLSNALKYSRDRTESVIEFGRLPPKDGEAVFYVRDNGVGFDMAYVDKLFGVFQRLHRVEEFEGTGIGLANVRRIVERHGGHTWAEGKLGEGATFFFTLPLRGEDI